VAQVHEGPVARLPHLKKPQTAPATDTADAHRDAEPLP
jgi:hypothetical protein